MLIYERVCAQPSPLTPRVTSDDSSPALEARVAAVGPCSSLSLNHSSTAQHSAAWVLEQRFKHVVVQMRLKKKKKNKEHQAPPSVSGHN